MYVNNDVSDENLHYVNIELQNALNSIQLSNSPSLCAFLEFVVNETVNGRGDRIKAYTIATEAFGRGSEFDPSSDTIVRTTAGRVRKALQAYNREHGEDSRVVISLPKGGYIPSFEFRDAPLSRHPNVSVWSSLIRRLLFRSGPFIAASMFAVLAVGFVAFLWRETEGRPLSDDVVINVRPAEYVDQEAQSLARAIDVHLAPALARIRLARIIPPGAPDNAVNIDNKDIIPFYLETSITAGNNPKVLWQLIDAGSGHIVWTSRVGLSGTGSASVYNAADRIAFQVLGVGGAVPLTLERYRGKIFPKSVCISRSQVMEAVESNIVYPKLHDCLERIVARSPNNASAWAVLSTLYTYISYFYTVGNREERATLVEHAERAAEKAAELAPEAYLTKVALMHLSLRQGRIAQFDTLQQRLRKNYPGDIYLKIRIATRIARLGRGREALEIFESAENKF